jgi:hypothetical protein
MNARQFIDSFVPGQYTGQNVKFGDYSNDPRGAAGVRAEGKAMSEQWGPPMTDDEIYASPVRDVRFRAARAALRWNGIDRDQFERAWLKFLLTDEASTIAYGDRLAGIDARFDAVMSRRSA